MLPHAKEMTTVPAAEFNAVLASADRLPELQAREEMLRGLMARRRKPPVLKRRLKRVATPQDKAARAKRKAVRAAQREARRMNRRKKKR